METTVSIVILNYFNYQETFRCVKSIQQTLNVQYPIIIVENGSKNDSYVRLRERYQDDEQVNIVRAKENLGFARGNNLGIRYARKTYQSDYILLLNSDTLMTDPLYVEKLVAQSTEQDGVVEANVWDRKGIFAQPSRFRPSRKSALFLLLHAFCKYYHIYFPIKCSDKKCEEYLCQVGCAIMLTPTYFQFYDGLYSKTFLYGEEQILLILLKRARLTLRFVDDTYLIHNEGGSTELGSLEGSRKKEKKALKGYWNVFLAGMRSTRSLKNAAGK